MLLFLLSFNSNAQCDNTTSFGSAFANNDGLPHLISGCNYLGEYSSFSNATVGDEYEFTLEGGGYITVRDGASVLAHGAAPLTWVATTGVVQLHWNGNDSCSTDSSCHDTGYTNLSQTQPAPANDLCADAISIGCGDVVTGNTEAATGNGAPTSFCGTTPGDAGVWYSFVGTGGDVTLSTCNANTDYDTKLNVYSGDCGTLTCVGGDDDDFSCEHSIRHSLVEFFAEEGTTYSVYANGFSDSRGNFTLDVSCALVASIDGDCQTVYDGFQPAECADLSVSTMYGAGGNTYLWSTGETTASINVCPSETTTYSVTVTDAAGNTASDDTVVVVVDLSCHDNNGNKVSICHRSNDGSYHTLCISSSAVQAHLDHGDSLGSCEDTYTCDTAPACTAITAPANAAVDVSTNSTIAWNVAGGFVEGYTVSVGTTSGGTDVADNVDVGDATSYDPGTLDYTTTYYVTVTPYNGVGSSEGCSENSFTTEDAPWCGAPTIQCAQSTSGTTVGADTTDLEFCGTSLSSAPGVWYSFTGDGKVLQVTADTSGSDYDTKLGVFSGDCTALTCVGGNDDVNGAADRTSEVIFASELDVLYYVYVTGFSANEGNYNLTISCVDPFEDAIVVDCGTPVNTLHCYDSNEITDWFFTSSDGSPLTIVFNSGSIEDSFSATYDDLHIYDGINDSGALLYDSDLVGDSDLTGLTLTAASGSMYIFFDSDFSVSCASGSETSWDFDVSCEAAPAADDAFANLNTNLDWTMYPNPAKGQLNLGLENFAGQNVTVNILSITNRSILNHTVGNLRTPNVSLNVSSIPTGVYFVRITTDKGQFVKQFIKR